MNVVDLTPDNEAAIREIASFLGASMAPITDAWPTEEEALREVIESLGDDRLSLIAIDDYGEVVGWVGGIEQYDGHVWELHPIAVRPDRQRQGIGRALVEALEHRVKERGGLTLWAGSDDEMGLTSLYGVDLYPGVLAKLAALRDVKGHAFGFYQRMGFEVVGVMPDANGSGKPDIFLAKRVG